MNEYVCSWIDPWLGGNPVGTDGTCVDSVIDACLFVEPRHREDSGKTRLRTLVATEINPGEIYLA